MRFARPDGAVYPLFPTEDDAEIDMCVDVKWVRMEDGSDSDVIKNCGEAWCL